MSSILPFLQRTPPVVLACLAAVAAIGDEPLAVADGREVRLEYTLELSDGSTADTNVDGEPFVYVHGHQQLLPALERELEGLVAGDRIEVRLSVDDGYGPVDPELVQQVDPGAIPEDGRRAGEILLGYDGQGRPFQARVAAVHDDAVVVDFNHPLAGEALHFTVTVLDVR